MSLLRAKFVKKNHILAKIYFTFLKNVLNKLGILLIPNFDLSEKIRETVTT